MNKNSLKEAAYVTLGIFAVVLVLVLVPKLSSLGNFTLVNDNYITVQLGPNLGYDDPATFKIEDSNGVTLTIVNTLDKSVIVSIEVNGPLQQVVSENGDVLPKDSVYAESSGDLTIGGSWKFTRSLNYYGHPSDYYIKINGNEYVNHNNDRVVIEQIV